MASATFLTSEQVGEQKATSLPDSIRLLKNFDWTAFTNLMPISCLLVCVSGIQISEIPQLKINLNYSYFSAIIHSQQTFLI
jgi:hypothetical protein